MKIYILLLILCSMIFQVLSEIPVWNFESLSIDLLSENSSFEYTTYEVEDNDNNLNIQLKKVINKTDNNNFIIKNYLTVNSETKEVEFDDIGSYYPNIYESNLIICPKGKFNPYDFENEFEIIIQDLIESDDWDLKCELQCNNYLLIFYLRNNNPNFFYVYSPTNKMMTTNNDGLMSFAIKVTDIYDFRLDNECEEGKNEYNFRIISNTLISMIYFFSASLKFDGETVTADTPKVAKTIASPGTNYHGATFDKNDDTIIYYFFYNNFSDFLCGELILSSDYSIEEDKIENTPFNFIDDNLKSEFEISYMRIIYGTKYAYYKLSNKISGKNYYGIIDLVLIQVLYNTDEEISIFIPYSESEMLAITSNSAYKLCIIKKDNKCMDSCGSDEFIINQEGNKCYHHCSNNEVRLIPDDECITKENCDTNIFVLNENETECGYCNYFYPNSYKYKLINSPGCLDYIPDNTEYVNETLNLLKCKIGYYLNNIFECIPNTCYQTCDLCYESSNSISDQKCFKCKSNYILKSDNNCYLDSTDIVINITNTSFIDITESDLKCLEGKFLDEDNICHECNNNCKKYEINKCNCLECYTGFYLENQKQRCFECDNECKEFNENTCECKSCFEGYHLNNYKCIQNITNETNEINSSENEIYKIYGYYNNLDEKILILETDNITDIENNVLYEIKKKLSSGEINQLYIDNGNYFLVELKQTKFIIASSEDKNDDISKIDLGQCKEKLKENISDTENNTLYILYIEISQEGMYIPRTEYEVYYKSENNKFENLNLSVCLKMKINKSISINISEDDIDKYNSSSGFYNDICYTYTSNSGTDITLKDRREEFINNNMTLCEENCDFTAYDTGTGKAICSCPISESIPFISNIKIDKEKLKSNFVNFKNIANINMFKCYKNLFSKNISSNIGNYIISPIILLGIVSFFVFHFYSYKLFRKLIKDIVDAKSLEKKDNNNNINKEDNEKIIDKEENINNIITDDIKNFEKIENKNKILQNKIVKKPVIKKKKKLVRKSAIKFGVFPPRKSGKFIIEDSKTNIFKNNNKNKGKEANNVKINNQNEPSVNSINKIEPEVLDLDKENKVEEKKEINNDIMEYNDSELNILPYEQAIEYDHRTYIQYYISLLRTKHLLIFSFYSDKDYNSRIIKINLFFFTFVVNFAVNALFFNDSTMHKIYEDAGEFNFIYQIPQIIYSTIISSVIIILVRLSALSEKNVLKIKNAKKQELSEVYMLESNHMYCKFICFFIIIFSFLFLFWYFVGCFCAVYKNTQIHLLNDTLISFSTSLIYPLFIYLIPGIFRIKALKDKEKKKKYLYNFSKIIQMFI